MSNNDLTVGRVYSTTMNHPSGITEVLLEKTQRELDEALKRAKDCGSHMLQVCKELEAGEMDCAIDAAIMVMGKLKRAEKDNAELADRFSGLELSTTKQLAELERERNMAQSENKRLQVFASNIHAELMESRKENEEQARLLGSSGSREARLTAERDHYKASLEEISTSIDDWLNSLIQEPSLDFIHAIKAYAQKKLNEIA